MSDDDAPSTAPDYVRCRGCDALLHIDDAMPAPVQGFYCEGCDEE